MARKLSTRLDELEKRHSEPPRIFVQFEGDDYGTCNGERISVADWEAMHPNPDDYNTLHVGYDKTPPGDDKS